MRTAKNIYDCLERIRDRPGMYLRNGSLDDLGTWLHGYYAAGAIHSLNENVPRLDRHFNDWLGWKTGRHTTAMGWEAMIRRQHSDDRAALDAFFCFVDEYRQMEPTSVATVLLGSHHQPTGKQISIGLDGKIEKPDRVDIMQYRPQPLFFHRLQYPDRVAVQDLLLSLDLTPYTLHQAKGWVREELQVEPQEWYEPTRVSLQQDWLCWNDGTIPRIAQAIYDDRRFSDLPVLADALEEAGCTNGEILAHCRGPGPHVRGCWVVDLILGKE